MAAPNKKIVWIGIGLVLVAVVILYRQLDLGHLLSLSYLKETRDALANMYRLYPLSTILVFFGIYFAGTALSIPGALILSLAAGAIFGLGVGLLIVSFASSLGALLAFFVARYLLRDTIQNRFRRQLAPINDGISCDGTFYLLTLRLVPIFPFWLINLLMGLTPIGALQFYIVSQIGMLPATAAYINAGTQLAAVDSAGDVLSPALFGSFVLLGILPLVAKWLVARLKARRLYAKWEKPDGFDRNLVVIGAGAAGLVSAYIATAIKAKVTLIEEHKMGGDCLNFGCVPSKALIRSAKIAKQLKEAVEFGLKKATSQVDFGAVMRRVHDVIGKIEPHDSVERYTKLGVDVIQGHARIVTPWRVDVTLADGSVRSITTRNIIIAAGASPFVPRIEGLEATGFLTSDTVWQLKELPRRLVVLGAGPLGCELAQSFARLGSKVTQVEMAARIMTREDPEAAELVATSLRADGIDILVGHQAVRTELRNGEKHLIVRRDGHDIAVPFDQLLCAVGRSPRVSGYGLEELGIPTTRYNTIETNAYLQTPYPNIYAIGDVAGPFQFTHTAAHQAWFATVNALFGRIKKFQVDYSVIPWTTFTDPEVARVGLSEDEARRHNIAFDVTRYGIDDLDRAIADGTDQGFVKVLTVPGKDRILGVTIVGTHAGDLLAEFVLAMKHRLGLNKILGTVHTYPTLSEANKYAAGEWKKAHVPKVLPRWLEKYHSWERS